MDSSIEAGADVNMVDKYGRSTLSWAGNNAEIVEILREVGAK
jgi:hypothetical protein